MQSFQICLYDSFGVTVQDVFFLHTYNTNYMSYKLHPEADPASQSRGIFKRCLFHCQRFPGEKKIHISLLCWWRWLWMITSFAAETFKPSSLLLLPEGQHHTAFKPRPSTAKHPTANLQHSLACPKDRHNVFCFAMFLLMCCSFKAKICNTGLDGKTEI